MADRKATHKKISRQEFIRFTGAVTGAGVLVLLYQQQSSFPNVYPPGAGEDFLAACNGCGRCVTICDQAVIEVGLEGKARLNTLEGFCDFCLLCTEVCQMGALTPIDPEEARIGVSIIDRERCLAWQWPSCRRCYERCLDLRSAIYLDDDWRPHVDASECNGCGACVQACPVSARDGQSRNRGRAVMLYRLEGSHGN